MKKLSVKKRHIVLLILIIAGFAAYFMTPPLESIVQKLVHKYGSQITGTEVNLGGFRLSLLNGEAELKNLTVGNPQNYSQPHIMSVGNVAVKVNLKSLLDDTIIVESVRVQKPQVTYELLSVTQNNVSALLENIKKNTASAAPKADKADKKDVAADQKSKNQSAGKKVIVKKIEVIDGSVNLAASLAGQSASASVPLPDIEMKDVGKAKSGGASIAETATAVLNKIFNSAYDAVVKSKLVDLKSVAEDGMNKVVESVKEKSGIKNWFGLGG